MIGPEEYVEFLSREYLRGYVDTGGCAVKFAVADDSVASDFKDRVVNRRAAVRLRRGNRGRGRHPCAFDGADLLRGRPPDRLG